jgi:hypothetical protein
MRMHTMQKIIVLSDGETWDSIEGCKIITLCEEELEKLSMTDKFTNDVRTLGMERTLSSDDTDWEVIARDFWQACENGDCEWVDSLCEAWHYAFIEEDEDESDE